MNVQDVINAAMEQARGSSSPSAIAEQRDSGSCADADVAKLAAALNFIGSNLDDPTLDKQANSTLSSPSDAAIVAMLAGNAALGGLGGYMGGKKRDKILARGGIDPRMYRAVEGSGRVGDALRGAASGVLGGYLGALTAHHAGHGAPIVAAVPGAAVGAALSYRKRVKAGRRAVRKYRDYLADAEDEKNAALRDAAAVGMTRLTEKLAEDRINPAKINAGPAEPFSGEVMPASSPVFGGAVSPEQLIAMKAQKVRDRINADMRHYVSDVGGGYDLSGHLSIFNK